MPTSRLTVLVFLLIALPLVAGPVPEWVQWSNTNSTILLTVMAKYSPETASRFGVDGHDADVTILPLDINARTIADLESAISQFEVKLSTEKDPSVLQDLRS